MLRDTFLDALIITYPDPFRCYSIPYDGVVYRLCRELWRTTTSPYGLLLRRSSLGFGRARSSRIGCRVPDSRRTFDPIL